MVGAQPAMPLRPAEESAPAELTGRDEVVRIDVRSNKGMKLTKPGELRSFAAYPRCSADVSERKPRSYALHNGRPVT